MGQIDTVDTLQVAKCTFQFSLAILELIQLSFRRINSGKMQNKVEL